MRRCALACVAAAVAAVFPSAAFGAALVPLAPTDSWLSTPLHATSPPGDPRLFVVERGGAVRIVKDGVLQAAPFLTVPNVETSGERGLLSIAFPPDYADSGLFYIFTVAAHSDGFGGATGDLRILEYRRSDFDPDLADPGSARLVLAQSHAATNHNGGQLAFGPDGLLYITMGDGANGANAQATSNDLGKVLRIDPPDPPGTDSFSVPPSNPFFGVPQARPEIYALGFRNPYRASFAPNGALVVADVGQSTWEEVDAGDLVGKNLGWPICEGACSPPDARYTDPVFQYPRDTTAACTAIIGGYVVRDRSLTGLTGRYLYGDLCRADLRTLHLAVASADPAPAGVALPLPGESLLGFGEDARGCVYVLSDKNAYRVAPDAGASKACPEPPLPAVGSEPGTPGATTGTLGPTLADTTPPGLKLGAAKHRLGRYVEILATCSEACTLRARGALRFSRKASHASTTLLGVSRTVRQGTRVRLRLKLRKTLRARARRVLKRGRTVSARVRVSATDAAGNATRKRVRERLTL